ncbi:hypothetical protein SH668x_002591 [Planctomicrobium sp. SH668]|uniref:hypothetical protein n=1 Tax=Planctomicrobium sp. SH668 TaxID=3448126 RepID=UPI003F5AE133
MAKMSLISKSITALGIVSVVTGCSHHRAHHRPICPPGGACATESACCEENPCGSCDQCSNAGWCSNFIGAFHRSSNAIPETLPLGSIVRAHAQVMETNAEAVDFVIYRLNFVGQTAELTSDGKDQVLEIAARMRSAPFPVLIEREPNNSDPELDALRRNLIAQILTDLGNPDAQQRTIVGTPYGPGYWSQPGQGTYYQFINSGGMNNFGGGYGGGYGGGGFGGGYGGGF